ncbi:hypothetical protein D910_08644 [Dendroctonus ponderosae]|uniref:Uncharacterized protein n=1 Tax=Dendroctonus ponderosae TaxID=77166 RepID=U4UE30_DENPD|nr:hypothetical protein D910_08644 [Dendroctonus ponderosae]
MSVIKSFSVFITISVALLRNGCSGAPNPCPQFLPVAVQLDQPYERSGPYNLKTLVRVKNDNEASKPHESNLVFPNDLEIPTVTTKQGDDLPLQPNTKQPNLTPKKRRRSRPKGALRTINDKPAEEVLRTDKASIARDLKDSTESALVAVKQLDQQM